MLDALSELALCEMRSAWMTAFGNAKLAGRDEVRVRDLPEAYGRRVEIGFVR